MKLRNLVSTLALVGLLTVGCAQLNADSDTDIVATEASAECTAAKSSCCEAKKAECSAEQKAECEAAKNDADSVN
jgi:hypothetical protein